MALVEISIDLGTEVLSVAANGEVIAREPCVLARSLDTRMVLAVGGAAARMLGRVGADIEVVRPVVHGRLADPEAAAQLIQRVLSQKLGWRWKLFPRLYLVMSDPADSYVCHSLTEALRPARCTVVPRALAAARGAGLPVAGPKGQAIVDFGAGRTEISILSLNQVIASRSLPIAGQSLDEALRQHSLNSRELNLSQDAARELKHSVGCAVADLSQGTCLAWGRELASGMPRQLEFSAREVADSMADPLTRIARGIQQALEQVPPGLAADLVDQGLLLTGGGALLLHLSEYLQSHLELPIRIAENPAHCGVLGASHPVAGPTLGLAS